MSRTFLDHDFLTWEAYPSAGDQGYSERPHIVFNCLSDRLLPPRYFEIDGDEADAERLVVDATAPQLSELLERSSLVT